jgi:hypothetical protein
VSGKESAMARAWAVEGREGGGTPEAEAPSEQLRARRVWRMERSRSGRAADMKMPVLGRSTNTGECKGGGRFVREMPRARCAGLAALGPLLESMMQECGKLKLKAMEDGRKVPWSRMDDSEN